VGPEKSAIDPGHAAARYRCEPTSGLMSAASRR